MLEKDLAMHASNHAQWSCTWTAQLEDKTPLEAKEPIEFKEMSLFHDVNLVLINPLHKKVHMPLL